MYITHTPQSLGLGGITSGWDRVFCDFMVCFVVDLRGKGYHENVFFRLSLRVVTCLVVEAVLVVLWLGPC